MSKPKEILIVGAGFSGLVQAYFLVRAGFSVKILEKSPRIGGLIGSEKKGEFLFEQGANAFLANALLEEMMSHLGVKLVAKKSEARKRFIYRNGQMQRWPMTLSESLPLLPFLVQKRWKNKKFIPKEDESLHSWGLRSLGESLTDNLLEPAMQGVYASSSDQLNAGLILNSLSRDVKKKKMRGSVAPLGGMQEFLDSIRAYLLDQGVKIKTSQEFSDFNFIGPKIFAVGLNSMRDFCNRQMPGIDPSILQTRSASLSSVALGFAEGDQRIRNGFGCLFPRKLRFNALGVLFNHSIFPKRVSTGASETWIFNDQNMEFSQMSSAALLRYVMTDRSRLGAWVEPTEVKLSQWSQRIPLYDNQLAFFLKKQAEASPPFLMVGNYLGDLGLSKILLLAQSNVKRILGGYFG